MTTTTVFPPRRTGATAALAVALALTAAGCAPAPAVAQASPPPAAAPAARARDHVDADVRFVHGMIGHHEQALVMAAMAPTHGASDRLQLLARKIDLSQRDEIASMRRWLEDRGLPLTADAHAGHGAHGADHATMPGMLTPAQLAELDAARGAAFDRLFLTYMIRHHEGALTMVKELFAAPGGGQEPELFGLAADVDADQRAEIARMHEMLDTLPPSSSTSPR